MHSFTPVYLNKKRDVEIGILHDSDARLADAMLNAASGHNDHLVMRNEPYGPADGVTHTLKLHGIGNELPNVMLEIANNLIASRDDQESMGVLLTGWLRRAMDELGVEQDLESPECRA